MKHLISNGSHCTHSTYTYGTIPYVQQVCGGRAAGGQVMVVGCGCLSKVDNEGWWLRHLLWK